MVYLYNKNPQKRRRKKLNNKYQIMKNYVLHYEETEVCIANLDISMLNKDDSKKSILDSEKQKLALQLIKGWISDVTEGNVTVKGILKDSKGRELSTISR